MTRLLFATLMVLTVTSTASACYPGDSQCILDTQQELSRRVEALEYPKGLRNPDNFYKCLTFFNEALKLGKFEGDAKQGFWNCLAAGER